MSTKPVQPEPRITSPKKGRFLSVAEVQQMLPRRENGRLVSRWWVLENVAPTKRIPYARTVGWFEQDVVDWLVSFSGRVHPKGGPHRSRNGRKQRRVRAA